MAVTDIAALVPRVRRALEGPVPVADAMTDQQITDVVADAIADIVLLTGSAFGKTFEATSYSAEGVPESYATSDPLTLPEQGVIAAQAALSAIYFRLMTAKTSEKISDEAQSWEWTVSATALRDLLKALTDARDKALDALGNKGSLVHYESFLAVRDAQTSRIVEPWVGSGYGGGLEVDWRFGGIG